MKSALAGHFRGRRREMNLTVGQLGRLIGYRNVSRGARRIHRFEKTGHIHPDLLAKLVVLLDVDEAFVRSLIREDRRTFLSEWAEWAAQPIRPYVVIRLMAGWYSAVSLPDRASDFSSAEAFAAAKAVESRRDVCLVWSRRLSVMFDATGAVTARTESVPGGEHTPWLKLGGKHFLPGVGEVGWPQRPQSLNDEA